MTAQVVPLNRQVTAAPGLSQGGGSPPPPTEADVRRKTIHNEQVKLQATILNTIGAGFFVAGLITPLTVLGIGTAKTDDVGQAFALIAFWLVASYIMHKAASLTLETLK